MLARAVPLVLLGVSAVYLFFASQLPFGTTARPGAAFYPSRFGLFGVVVGFGATIAAFRGPGAVSSEPPLDADSRRRVAITVVALAAFCLALPWIGYPLAAFAFVSVLLRALGSGWIPAVITGVLSAAVSYGLFATLLDVPLPRGWW
jgi:hypothetical protein